MKRGTTLPPKQAVRAPEAARYRQVRPVRTREYGMTAAAARY